MTDTATHGAARPVPARSHPRVLATLGRPDWATHLATHGPLPSLVPNLVEILQNAGLVGHGGAAFPVWRKIASLAGAPAAIIANAAEGEPLSHKDAVLLANAPQLVLDGLLVLAGTLAPRAKLLLYVNPLSLESAERAVADRPDGRRIQVVAAADGFVAGEVSAVVDSLSGGRGVPRDHPHHLTERGLKGKPTLVFNVETLAHLALIARHGPEWFRSVGTPDDPGTRLISVSGAGLEAHVREVDGGTPLGDVLARCGLGETAVQAVLVGGYHGAWVERSRLGAPLTAKATRTSIGAGAGVIHVLGVEECGIHASGAILRYLASQSAQQCGPCLFGLPTLSGAFDDVTTGSGRQGDLLQRMLATLPGRGACHHPDGTVRFATSALGVFADEVTAHRAGRCRAAGARR
ncbi:NADH-ubiquinone oxidoreductase-F iron-sulfur binding region domain-containing protein [Herbiconiux sp.]|uniref:NADH-ubiquinone oxidoreductase-F iron-sulfur binding region domain-containing protein n=1 Tax=Herbiconiux sp. TaxID=1871186 RepID=UPI0025C0AE3B|nr:NADH-ubiquinone oxidoreductase-F iron-sulfur binding region domain-containing protein [Herbiconiux sp.]